MRTLEEINKEYSQAAADLGVAIYDLHIRLPDLVNDLKMKIKVIHQEANALKKEEK